MKGQIAYHYIEGAIGIIQRSRIPLLNCILSATLAIWAFAHRSTLSSPNPSPHIHAGHLRGRVAQGRLDRQDAVARADVKHFPELFSRHNLGSGREFILHVPAARREHGIGIKRVEKTGQYCRSRITNRMRTTAGSGNVARMTNARLVSPSTQSIFLRIQFPY